MGDAANTWVSIAEKVAKSGLGSLGPEESIVFRAFTFVTELEMGGASGALYNLSPSSDSDQHQWVDLRAAAELLASIGDRESGQLLVKAADVLENLPEPLGSTWEESMESASAQLPPGFWEVIEARVANIYDSLEAYTSIHFP